MNQQPYSLKKVTLLVFGALALLMLIIFLFTNSFLIVNTSNERGEALISAEMYGGEVEPKPLRKGFNILRAGSYKLSMSEGISLTSREIDLGIFRIHKVSLGLEPQKQTTKVARGADECVYGSPEEIRSGTIHSHDCINPSEIFLNRFNSVSRKEVFLSQIPTLRDPGPFQAGLAGIALSEEDIELVYIKNSEIKKKSLNSQNGFVDNGEYKLFTETNALYLFETTTKTVFTLTEFEDKPQQIPLKIDGDVKLRFSAIRTYVDGFYVFNGSEPPENHSDSIEGGVFYAFNKSGGEPTIVAEVDNGADNLLDFVVLDKNIIFSTSLDQSTIVYRVDDRELVPIHSLTNTRLTAAHNGELYYQRDQNIYKYRASDKTSSLVFGSAKMQVSKIQTVNGLLLLNAYSNTERNPVNHTYILEDKPVTGITRIEDMIPYGDIDTQVSYMDYFGNTIYIALNLESFRASPLGNYTFDQEEFNAVKNEVQKQLTADGITQEKYTIIFSPY